MTRNLKDELLLKYRPQTVSDIQRAGKMVCPIRMSIILSGRVDEQNKWCQNNLENDYILFSDAIYTKTEEEAMAFKLRWI